MHLAAIYTHVTALGCLATALESYPPSLLMFPAIVIEVGEVILYSVM
jgi:hypothetical protein